MKVAGKEWRRIFRKIHKTQKKRKERADAEYNNRERCTYNNKICYEDKSEALAAIEKIRLDNMHVRQREECRVYECQACGKWHITSKKRK